MSFNRDRLIPADMSKNVLTDDQKNIQLNTLITKECANTCPIIWDNEFCITNGLSDVFSKDGQTQIHIPDLMSIHEETEIKSSCMSISSKLGIPQYLSEQVTVMFL